MSYVIAFSNEGATDVTRRYVRDAAAHSLERGRAPEEVLLYILHELRQMRRADLAKEDKRRLVRDDQREERELRGYVVLALTTEIERMIPRGRRSGAAAGVTAPASRPAVPPSSEVKLPARTTGTDAWRRARGENGEGGEAEPGDDAARRDVP